MLPESCLDSLCWQFHCLLLFFQCLQSMQGHFQSYNDPDHTWKEIETEAKCVVEVWWGGMLWGAVCTQDDNCLMQCWWAASKVCQGKNHHPSCLGTTEVPMPFLEPSWILKPYLGPSPTIQTQSKPSFSQVLTVF